MTISSRSFINHNGLTFTYLPNENSMRREEVYIIFSPAVTSLGAKGPGPTGNNVLVDFV